jgi:hypothetical protein
VLIEENAHTYIIICVCIVFLKKLYILTRNTSWILGWSCSRSRPNSAIVGDRFCWKVVCFTNHTVPFHGDCGHPLEHGHVRFLESPDLLQHLVDV